MQPMRPKKPIGWVVSCARASARETHEGVVSVAIGCTGDPFAPPSPIHAGSVPTHASPAVRPVRNAAHHPTSNEPVCS